MFTTISVAAISLKPIPWDKPANVTKLESCLLRAVKKSPQLIVATEGVLEGYVVVDAIRNPAKARAMREIAEPIDGPCIRRFRKLAGRVKTCLVFGFAELVGNDVYNTAIFIDARGEIRGHYRKVQFAEGNHPSWFFNRLGKSIRAFDTPFGRAGLLICNDRWNPDIARTLVLDGAQYLLISSYGDRTKRQNETVLGLARANGVPIVEANVGMNLIISKGEVSAYKWGNDAITFSTIDIPHPSSTANARRMERSFMRWRRREMSIRYRQNIARFRAGELRGLRTSITEKGRLLPSDIVGRGK